VEEDGEKRRARRRERGKRGEEWVICYFNINALQPVSSLPPRQLPSSPAPRGTKTRTWSRWVACRLGVSLDESELLFRQFKARGWENHSVQYVTSLTTRHQMGATLTRQEAQLGTAWLFFHTLLFFLLWRCRGRHVFFSTVRLECLCSLHR